jgi:hypothetical protein
MAERAVEVTSSKAAAEPTAGETNLWSYPWLLALAIGGPMLEVALLWALGFSSALGIAPGVTAPAPFATFHDLRWLIVYHRSWPGFVAEAAALLAFRGAMTALLVALAWPRSARRPSAVALLVQGSLFTLASAVLLAPWAGLLFGLAVMPVSWLFFAAIPPVLAIGLLIHHGTVRDGWRRNQPPLRTAGWVALSFAVLTLSGAALSASPPALRLPVAAASGLFNAWAWSGIVHVLALAPRVPRRVVPLVPIALVLLLAVVATGAGLGFRVNQANHGSLARLAHPLTGRPVLLVTGFGGDWDGVPRRWLDGDFDVRRFSYSGQDVDGHPLPYRNVDTHRPLPKLVHAMAAQVEALHRDTRQPVAIVAESEGALVAKVYLAANPGAPVDELVMLSPLVQPARVWYPREGDDGWGLAAGWELRELGGLFHDLSGANLSADMPVVRSLLDHGPALRDLLACPLPSTHQLALFPLADAVATPHPSEIGIPSEVVPAFHGGLLAAGSVREVIAHYLADGTVPAATIWPVAQQILRASAAAWQVPELPLTLNKAWSGPAGRAPSCDAISASLRAWLG